MIRKISLSRLLIYGLLIVPAGFIGRELWVNYRKSADDDAALAKHNAKVKSYVDDAVGEFSAKASVRNGQVFLSAYGFFHKSDFSFAKEQLEKTTIIRFFRVRQMNCPIPEGCGCGSVTYRFDELGIEDPSKVEFIFKVDGPLLRDFCASGSRVR